MPIRWDPFDTSRRLRDLQLSLPSQPSQGPSQRKSKQRYNVYWKQVGGQIRKSTCLSHEDAIKKQGEFRVLDGPIQGGVENNKRGPESTSTKRKGNYIGGPGRGNRRSVTTKSSLSVHKNKAIY